MLCVNITIYFSDLNWLNQTTFFIDTGDSAAVFWNLDVVSSSPSMGEKDQICYIWWGEYRYLWGGCVCNGLSTGMSPISSDLMAITASAKLSDLWAAPERDVSLKGRSECCMEGTSSINLPWIAGSSLGLRARAQIGSLIGAPAHSPRQALQSAPRSLPCQQHPGLSPSLGWRRGGGGGGGCHSLTNLVHM